MKYTKYVITTFAVFASLLMLMTPTIARTVPEKVTMDAIDLTEKELISSVEDVIASPEIVEQEPSKSIEALLLSIEDDEELTRIATLIKEADDTDEQVALASGYITSLQDNDAFNALLELFESEYSDEIEAIMAEIEGYVDEFEIYGLDNQEEYLIGGAIPLPDMSISETSTIDSSVFSLTIDLSSSSVISSEDSTFTIDSNTISGTVQPINGDSDGVFPDGFSEPEDAFFYLTNINGDVYLPGYGWIDGSLWDTIADLLDQIGWLLQIFAVFFIGPVAIGVGLLTMLILFPIFLVNGGVMTPLTDLIMIPYLALMALYMTCLISGIALSSLSYWMSNNPPD